MKLEATLGLSEIAQLVMGPNLTLKAVLAYLLIIAIIRVFNYIYDIVKSVLIIS